MTKFQVGETYRIQNVDYGTYLDMTSGLDKSKLQLRSFKEWSKEQQVRALCLISHAENIFIVLILARFQWCFERSPGLRDRYWLRNVGYSGASGERTSKPLIFHVKSQGSDSCCYITSNPQTGTQWIHWEVEYDEARDEYL